MLGSRVLSSVVLVILALVTILSGGKVLAATLWGISIIAFYELCKACGVSKGENKKPVMEITGNIFITLYYLAMAVERNPLYMILTVLLALLAMLCVYVFTFPKYRAEQVMSAYFSFMYAPVLFSFLYLTREMENGIYLVWMIFISSWISDTCAYAVGMLFGKHKLAPVLSPKKSVEGSVGGILGSAIVGGLFGLYLAEHFGVGSQIFWIFAVLGALGSVVSQIGDLAASAIKRNHDIKDYGKLIPGHGGIMDRFDSVVVTAPIIYFLCVLLLTP